MEFYEAVNNRHAVRERKDVSVSQEVSERIIAIGLKAPTHNRLRNWESIVLHDLREKENALRFVKA